MIFQQKSHMDLIITEEITLREYNKYRNENSRRNA